MLAFRNRFDIFFSALALIFLFSTILFYIWQTPLWWYAYYLTAIAVALYFHGPRIKHRISSKALFISYIAAILMGGSVEFVRITFDLWPYAPILNGVIGVVGFMAFGYFLMMFSMALTYDLVKQQTGRWPIAAFIVVLVLILPVEVGNQIVPVWEEPNHIWVYLLFIIGYAIEIIVAVKVFQAITRCS
ncbi:hypothetical protein [Maritalea mediterranea]|uniref:Uncharacterized protein n=1 Tax=Maritalea mediterranea TaxID=2909667 RepID=A0ABS9E9G2_9HYPH|nr:hypothetical protein [Maritalea mediterranea]MCF4099520.1 hypothetical protein [Maritalea mediterranea]